MKYRNKTRLYETLTLRLKHRLTWSTNGVKLKVKNQNSLTKSIFFLQYY